MSLDLEVRQRAIGKILDDALTTLAERDANLANEIRPILTANAERGRIDKWLLTSEGQVQDYVQTLADQYTGLSAHIRKLQVDKDESLWAALFQKLIKWAYAYLLRKNFRPGRNALDLGIGLATQASIQILCSNFPFDVNFDFWCHRVLINTCAKYLRNEGRKANHMSILDRPVEDLAEMIRSEGPELLIEQGSFRQGLIGALAALAPARAHVVRGYYFQGKDFPTLANELGKSVAAVHSLHFHALNDLRRHLVLKDKHGAEGGR